MSGWVAPGKTAMPPPRSRMASACGADSTDGSGQYGDSSGRPRDSEPAGVAKNQSRTSEASIGQRAQRRPNHAATSPTAPQTKTSASGLMKAQTSLFRTNILLLLPEDPVFLELVGKDEEDSLDGDLDDGDHQAVPDMEQQRNTHDAKIGERGNRQDHAPILEERALGGGGMEHEEAVVEEVQVRRDEARDNVGEQHILRPREMRAGVVEMGIEEIKGQGEHAVVHEERHHGGDAEMEQRPVDPDRVADGMEMARRVRIQIDGGNRNLDRLHLMILRVREHPHFVLVTVPLEAEHPPQEAGRDAAEPRLGVADHKSRHQEEEPPCPEIAEAGPERHVAGEFAHAEDERLRMGD